MVRTFILIAILGPAAFAGCKRESGSSQTDQQDARIVAEVVARVGGVAIGAAEVEARMAAEDLRAEAALHQLIDEELLIQEAARLGFTEDRDVERGIERLMVRAMLRDLEQENTPESISEEEVRADYAFYADRFQVPERRRSWHLLVKDSSDAGQALAASILRELNQADDPRSVYERYAEAAPQGTDLEVKAEDLPAISIQASIENPYKDAIFAAKSEGPLKKIVKTSYGWHAIVVAEILPAETRTIDDVEDETRTRLSQQKRFEKVVAIVEGLEGQGLVRYDEQGVERLLSMAGLPERAQ